MTRSLFGPRLGGRSIFGPRVTSVQRRHVGGGSAPAFNPLSLEPHLWLDPSDLSTLFQDSAMTTPVTADGDPVGAILDKSGNGFHLTQSTAGARPLYRTSGDLHWLEFDGTDDFLSVTFSAISQPWDRLSAFRRLDTEDPQRLLGSPTGNGQLYVTSNQIRIFSGTELTGLAAPAQDADFVVTERHDGASSRIAVDNGSYNTGDAGAGTLDGLSIGKNITNSEWAFCRFSGLMLKSGIFTDTEIALLRTYLAAKQGREL